ncbi:cache domain-containing protein [Dechloromonas sp. A34]|uniref:cache domain-containing protein n=1 Tax=Dechloromonas sp. A34 TaxID=447588 RepID=UPI002248A6E1|nr:cache domain-containing protein [Dechloromonas sp. A34]
MFALLNRLSVRNRIWGIVLIFIGSTVLGGALDVVLLRETLHQEKESAIRQVVDSGYGVLAHYLKLEQDGSLSRDAAQTAAMATIKGMRYNGDDYFWLNDDKTPPRMIMHPIVPAFDGQSLVEPRFNSATGLRSGTDGPFVATDGRKNILQAFAEVVAQTGDGYVTYLWPRTLPGGAYSEEKFPKLSYVKKLPAWGWIIGSGIYIDDIDAAVKARAGQNLLLLLGTSAVLLLLASLIARSITRPLQTTMGAMRGIASGKAGFEQRVAAAGPDEISELASNFNDMLDHIQARDQALLKHQERLEEEVSSRTASLRETNLKLDAELRERKLAEQAVLDSEERFRGIASVAQDAIIMMDAVANISFWNPAAEQIFGYRREEAVGRDLHALIAPQRFHADFRRGYLHFAQTGQGSAVGRAMELIAVRQDGSEFPIELSLSAIWLHGAWSSVGIVRDISERKRSEKELQENLERVQGLNQQLEAAQNQLLQSEKMASIGQLAAGVAHEINNPIGFVSSNLGTLEEYADDLLAIVEAYGKADHLLDAQPELRADIESLKARADLAFLSKDLHCLLRESHDGIERVKKIVQDLKDFSRIDNMDWAMANLEQGLDSTLNIVWNEIKYKADIVKEYGGIPLVECLGSQMNQVFMNLLVNAAQAIDGHGTITIRTGVADERVWIEIADTGKGIPLEVQKRIFDPFFTTKPVGQGTGLGLSLAYSIVQKHHGTLEVASEPGRGSSFRLEIPRRQPARQEAVAQAESVPA